MSSRTSPQRAPAHALPPFEHVVEQHGRAVLRYCVTEAGAERGEDCFQETMLAALRAYVEVRDPAAIRGWLFAIAARKVIDTHRAVVRAPEPVEEIAVLARTDEDGPRDVALWARVARLPEKQRRAVTLRYVGDLSHREIAQVMEISEAAARRNVFEGLARLERELRASSSPRSHEPVASTVRRT